MLASEQININSIQTKFARADNEAPKHAGKQLPVYP